ncbi:MAG: glutaredoxin family protein [Bacillota bacterium]|uniref:glutaredoxin family protein n=1 Tax=unclassified Virgibacillus TaxID=2620237 RepID=UPI001D16F265|nr:MULTISPECIES: glutaredoxin family protein [unclassified Virgibacillus]MCC2251457.1 glutaredoxin family protein [Virgibacillus sp. AGTR]MDY7044856.1 glutaredoxin family protein [Virgibacillus sp. M23]
MKNIIVYGTEWCSYCVKLKKWLKENNYGYEFKDIDNEENNKEFDTLEVQGIPFVIINDNKSTHTVEGFNPEKIKKIMVS